MPSHSTLRPLLSSPPSMSLPPLLLLLLLPAVLLFSGYLPVALSAGVTLFSNCNRTFSCGSLRNITYPFTGGDRPEHCGPPGFQLSCRDGYAELNMRSLIYRVLRIDQTGKNLILTRLDLWNNTCPSQFANSTLDYGVGNEDLNLFYGCDKVGQITSSNQFNCNASGNSSYAYYLIGAVPSDPILKIIRCNTSLKIPVLQSATNRLTANKTTLGEALTVGFNVNYSNPYDANCSACIASGGQCGYDYDKGEPICVCSDRICHSPGHEITGTAGLVTKIAIGISAGVAGIILLFSVICCLRRKCLLGKALVFWKKETEGERNVEAFIRNCGPLATKRYKYSDVKKMTNSFECKLGEGGFGCVYKGKLSDGRLVAVKLLNKSKGDGEEFINEVASISRTSHVNIVTLVGFCFERSRRALIYEFMLNGSLDGFIYQKGSPNANLKLEWKTMYQIAVGIARGLEYLYRGCNTRILHFDIKPHNILLDEDFCPKISDFGLAKLCQRKESIVSMTGARGTAGYIAPEVFCRNFGGVSHKSDVYSYGMLVLELVGGRKNRGAACTSDTYFPHWIYKNLELGEDLILGRVMTQEEEEIVRKMILVSLWCIQTNPMERPSIHKVIEMLEGSLQALETPPKPFLFSPTKSPQASSATSVL